MSAQKNLRVILGFVLTIFAFASLAGYEEYSLLSNGVQTEDGHGGTRPLTDSEIYHSALETAGYSLIPGMLGSGLLLLAASGASRFLSRMSLPAAIVGSVLFGGISGLALSLFGFFLLGGLSPRSFCLAPSPGPFRFYWSVRFEKAPPNKPLYRMPAPLAPRQHQSTELIASPQCAHGRSN